MNFVPSMNTSPMIAIIFLCVISSAYGDLPEDLPPGTKVYMDYENITQFLEREVAFDLDIEVVPVRQWGVKPKKLQIMNSYVAKIFGGDKMLGVELELDENTQLYKPPPASGGYLTENDRVDLMWFNEDTYQNYCTERIGRTDFVRSISAGVRVICTDDFNRDKCCGEEDRCHCLKASIACTCISEKDNERRVQMMKDFQEMYDSVSEKIEEIAAKVIKA